MANIFTVFALVCSLLLSAGLAHGDCNGQLSYLDPKQVDLAHILAPPPRLNSQADQADFAAVLTAQHLRTAADIALVNADTEFSVFRFSTVLGPTFTADNLPVTTAFFKRVFCDENAAIEAVKKHFMRPRPFVTHAEINPAAPQLPTASYPSGHSTFAYTHAILLAIMVPEKVDELFARADQYAHNRVIAGVHYPTDIEAGRISAAVIDNVLLNDKRFMLDFEKARAEIRRALNLGAI